MDCNSSTCSCGGVSRRDFIRLTGAGAAAAALTGPLAAVAGPFETTEFEKLIPADKRLSPEWLQSLTARGARTVYRGADLEKIGMPVGGLCCGQVYLGGDGQLWHWDIFNRHIGTGAEHYARPLTPQSPFDQGFALLVASATTTQVRPLSGRGWSDIRFTGEYPVGSVEYRDPESPVEVALEAFSPFVPLDVDASSQPATVMRFTVKNTSGGPVEAELAGWLENAVCLHSRAERSGQHRNRVVRRGGLLAVECSAEPPPEGAEDTGRADILFDDFERETYDRWTAEGAAFGKGPIARSAVPDYQGDLGMEGQHAVNSHAAASGGEVGGRDAQTGTLTSTPFTIERRYITFLIGGGNHKGKTCVNLLVDDKVVLSAVGPANNRMRPVNWDVRPWAGRIAKLQAVDAESGAWGNIGLDHIVFSDRPRSQAASLAEETDFGTMTLALLEARRDDRAVAALPDAEVPPGLFAHPLGAPELTAARPFGTKLVGGVTRPLQLKAGEAATATFLVTWHFPNLRMDRLPPGRFYATRFPSAIAVAENVAKRFDELRRQTLLWRDTWYDSTLPYWFLDRTFLNTSILASSTCFRFGDGRFYGWEGVGCCAGTCGHVWQYAHAVARLFPALERDTRERVDFGLALKPDGAIHFRAEHNNIPAIDAQAGTVLRALREHQMGTDDTWLKRNWPGIKRATEWLIARDGDGDGLIVGGQHNTLDTDWFGPVAWLSGMYLAALRAAEVMAQLVGDDAFAVQCRTIVAAGVPKLVAELFEGDYFINKPDPARADTINSGSGCHIDQVFGQSWAFQVGLGRVFPAAETVSALKSLWRFNFTPDVGPWRDANKPGRWYAMPGEGGLIMCTFPRADWNYGKAKGKGADWAAGYFNECMNGFEYQAAGHMLWENLVTEGLAVTRMVHDRYHASRRNPWNEVECGDHYARSMASYGVFLAACGFEYDGPRRHMAFAPRLAPENFKAAFTSAEGWGSYTQKAEAGGLKSELRVAWGTLRLKTLALAVPADKAPGAVKVTVAGKRAEAALAPVPDEPNAPRRVLITLAREAKIEAGETLAVELTA